MRRLLIVWSILTVAPIGTVKLATFLETFELPVTALIVNGRVTIEEQVENAVSNAVDIPL